MEEQWVDKLIPVSIHNKLAIQIKKICNLTIYFLKMLHVDVLYIFELNILKGSCWDCSR